MSIGLFGEEFSLKVARFDFEEIETKNVCDGSDRCLGQVFGWMEGSEN